MVSAGHVGGTRGSGIVSHNKHTRTNHKAATDQHSRHNHEVHRKLHQGTQSLPNIQKLHTYIQRKFKTGVPQGGVLSPIFNIYTTDLPPPIAPVQVMTYADDITITSTHTNTSAARKYIACILQT